MVKNMMRCMVCKFNCIDWINIFYIENIKQTCQTTYEMATEAAIHRTRNRKFSSSMLTWGYPTSCACITQYVQNVSCQPLFVCSV